MAPLADVWADYQLQTKDYFERARRNELLSKHGKHAAMVAPPVFIILAMLLFGKSLFGATLFVLMMNINVAIWFVVGSFVAMLAISRRVEGGGGSRHEILPCGAASAGISAACWLTHTGMIEGVMVCCLCNGVLFRYVRSKGEIGATLSGKGVACSMCGLQGCIGGCCV